MFIADALCAGVRRNGQQRECHGGVLHVCGRGVVDGGGTARTSVSAPSCTTTLISCLHHCSGGHAMVSMRGGVLVFGGFYGLFNVRDTVWMLTNSVRVYAIECSLMHSMCRHHFDGPIEHRCIWLCMDMRPWLSHPTQCGGGRTARDHINQCWTYTVSLDEWSPAADMMHRRKALRMVSPQEGASMHR